MLTALTAVIGCGFAFWFTFGNPPRWALPVALANMLLLLFAISVEAEVICTRKFNPLSGRWELDCKEDNKTIVCEEYFDPLSGKQKIRCREK